MIKRNIEREIKTLFSEFPIVAILGPRQSGKTTLSKMLFSDFEYISFEDIDNREFAQEDPRGLLSKYSYHAIFDGLKYWINLSKTKPENNFLVYGGTDNYSRNDINVRGWNFIKEILSKIRDNQRFEKSL